jgi:hypothetical protein
MVRHDAGLTERRSVISGVVLALALSTMLARSSSTSTVPATASSAPASSR